MRILIKRIKAVPERLRFKFYPKIAEYRIRRSTENARRILGAQEPIRVLVDNSVLAHAVTHETKWIATGEADWGNQIRGTGYAARVPVHSSTNDTFIHRQIVYLVGLASLAEAGLVNLYQSAELESERSRQPIGLYRGYSYLDLSLFRNTNIPNVDGHVEEVIMGWPQKTSADWAREQRERLASSPDALHHSLHKLLREQNPNKSDQDAWHIRTAERHNMFCFLTMDRKLLASCKSLSRKEPLRSLATKVLSPAEFGTIFGILPVPPRLLSYSDASWFVRADQAMPDEKRRRRNQYK